MLPALAYPGLKKSPHLASNYGTAWQNQRREFDEFSGAILATTNCVLIPKASYKDRMFTCGIANLPGVAHIKDHDFTPVIEKALALPPLPENLGPTTMTGFYQPITTAEADLKAILG